MIFWSIFFKFLTDFSISLNSVKNFKRPSNFKKSKTFLKNVKNRLKKSYKNKVKSSLDFWLFEKFERAEEKPKRTQKNILGRKSALIFFTEMGPDFQFFSEFSGGRHPKRAQRSNEHEKGVKNDPKLESWLSIWSGNRVFATFPVTNPG